MPDVTEIQLPGVGVRHEFTTGGGEKVGVLSYRGGRREIVVYDRADPDACRTVFHLNRDDAHTLAELLGASQIAEVISDVQQRLEGLAIDWLTLPAGSEAVGTTIGAGQFRTRTGVSVVAIIRGDTSIPAPGPEVAFEDGDVLVAIGTPDGLARMRDLLQQ
jgi:TrkA domain protein